MSEKEEGTYKRRVLCRNCEYQEEVEIPKGVAVWEWRVKEENKICPNCGCERK